MTASKDEQKRQKEAALAAALRANLKRRKTRAEAVAPAREAKEKSDDAAS